MGEPGSSELRNENFRKRCRRIIFQSDRRSEKLFDVLLIVMICLSVVAVLLDSVDFIASRYGLLLLWAEWVFTILFTIEYIFRIYVSNRKLRYMRSFFGVIDLLAILPTYVSLFVPGAQYLMSLRAIRVLRVFRVLKMSHYVGEANLLMRAIRASLRKIIVFVFSVVTLVLILGSIMYLVEGPENGYTSIPKAVYWAIVTLTTVGYGDISPQTPIGQVIASIVMITGYGIIAVPTGIVTAEIALATRQARVKRPCRRCQETEHEKTANYCRTCGERLVSAE